MDEHVRPVRQDGRSSASATSARAAANLSLERLYRKRAIDRENQRVLRQKNKNRLAELESEVRTLTARLEQAEAARSQAVQAAAHAQLPLSLQASLGELGDAAAVLAAAESGDGSSLDSIANSLANAIANSIASTAPGRSPAAPVASAAPTASRASIAMSGSDGTGTDRVMAGLSDDLWRLAGASVTVFDTPQNTDFSINIDMLTQHPPISAEPDRRRSSASSTASAYTFQNSTASSASSAHEAAVYETARTDANRLRHAVGSSPVWAVTPSYVPPTSAMDELLNLRGSAANAGLNASRLPSIQTVGAIDINGPLHPSSGHTLLNPIRGGPGGHGSQGGPGPVSPAASRSPNSAETSPSSAAIAHHVANTITALDTPERTALLYTICVYLRWLIAPAQDHYDAIPDFLRPTAAQLVIPHPFWVDTIAWPLARDRAITYLDYTHAHIFSALFARTFSINWPHALDGILQRGSGGGDDLVISPAFVQHVRDPANWSVGPELVDAFPFLDGAVSVHKSDGLL